jgi:hypothetical protein
VGKTAPGFSPDFSTNPHCALAKSKGAFFLSFDFAQDDNGWEALEKKVFFGTGKIRGSCWLKAVEAEFFVKTKRRKAFCIIPNYRQ